MNPDKNELIEAYLDDLLSEKELISFKAELARDEALRKELALAKSLKGLGKLHKDGAEWTHQDQLMNELEHMKPTALDQSVMQSLHQTEAKIQRQQSWSKTIFYAVAAQVLFTLVLTYFVMTTRGQVSAHSEVIGNIGTFEGKTFLVRNEEKLQLKPSMEIKHGDQLFVEEQGEIDFNYLDGSKITFLKYSYAQLNQTKAGKRILLYSGSLTGDIEKQPRGMPLKVITEHSESEVLGTKIEINSSDLSTLLQVKEGEVKMTPRNVEEGEGIVVGALQYAVGKSGNDVSLHQIQAPLVVSDIITKDTPGHGVDIDILLHGAEKLYLVVTNAGDGIAFDHAGWVNPVVSSAAGNVILSDTEWTFESCGWLKSRVNRGYHRDDVFVNNQQVHDVIVTHSNSIIVYDLPAGAKRFTAKAALLKSGLEQDNSKSSVTFEVYTDIPEEKLKELVRNRNDY